MGDNWIAGGFLEKGKVIGRSLSAAPLAKPCTSVSPSLVRLTEAGRYIQRWSPVMRAHLVETVSLLNASVHPNGFVLCNVMQCKKQISTVIGTRQHKQLQRLYK